MTINAPPETVDGRRERTRKNREALVRAMVELVRETGARPTAAEVAERAGLSRRTVFRLFEDMESVRTAAHGYVQAQVQERFPAPALQSLEAQSRITAFTSHLASVYEFISPIRRLGERGRGKSETRNRQLRSDRAARRRRVSAAFSDLLDSCDESERGTRLAAVDLLCSWQSWNRLREHQHCSIKKAQRIVETGLRRLLID